MVSLPDDVVALTSLDELATACSGELLALWAAQDFGRDVRAWAIDGAVAVASSQLSNRDRLVVSGAPDAAAHLVRAVLPLVDDSFRPLASPQVISSLAAKIPEITPVGEFAMMQTRTPLRLAPKAPVRAEWLEPATWPKVTSLLSVALPRSLAQPGVPGVRRWAGVRVDGELLASAADAWSAPGVGFVSGVATHPRARGRGYGAAVCRFLFEDLLHTHGALALFVNSDNEPAIRLYRAFGMELSAVAVARIERGPGSPA